VLTQNTFFCLSLNTLLKHKIKITVAVVKSINTPINAYNKYGMTDPSDLLTMVIVVDCIVVELSQNDVDALKASMISFKDI
jgi:hypothetical protein